MKKKKLNLQKETIITLINSEMNSIRGGAITATMECTTFGGAGDCFGEPAEFTGASRGETDSARQNLCDKDRETGSITLCNPNTGGIETQGGTCGFPNKDSIIGPCV